LTARVQISKVQLEVSQTANLPIPMKRKAQRGSVHRESWGLDPEIEGSSRAITDQRRSGRSQLCLFQESWQMLPDGIM
jgi:hypothetical protein